MQKEREMYFRKKEIPYIKAYIKTLDDLEKFDLKTSRDVWRWIAIWSLIGIAILSGIVFTLLFIMTHQVQGIDYILVEVP